MPHASDGCRAYFVALDNGVVFTYLHGVSQKDFDAAPGGAEEILPGEYAKWATKHLCLFLEVE